MPSRLVNSSGRFGKQMNGVLVLSNEFDVVVVGAGPVGLWVK
jgi:ribulose 1,5-bisphosphate synthetase/thiazole synthase